MRPVTAYLSAAAWLVFAALPVGASVGPKHRSDVTLLLQFEQPAPERVLAEVERELNAVMRTAGIKFDLRLFTELSPYQEFQDLVVVRIKGECRLDPRPSPRADPGPLAFAHTSDGQVLPFMEVGCERIKAAIRPVMWGDHFRRADEILGRAIGRVMAHELYHILGQTCGHGDNGIAKHTLSGAQLIGETLSFDAEDVERIQVGGSGGN